MKILLSQTNPVVGALAQNIAAIAGVWARNRDIAELIVFPEFSVTGYPLEDLAEKPSFLDAVEAAVATLCAQHTGGAALVVSAPWRLNGHLYNALLFIDNGRIAHIIPKHHLPDYGVFDEPRIFESGPLPMPVPFRGRRLGLMTCEDMWYPDVAAHLKAQGADVLIVANGSPYELGKTDTRIRLAQSRTEETELPLCYLNLTGGQDEIVFDGASFGMNDTGTLAFRLKAFAPDEVLVTLDAGEWLPEKTECWPNGAESQFQALKLALHDYVGKNGFKGVLVGLSGGIDSALVAVIAAEALGPKNVHCVMMPSPYTAQISLDDAEQLAKNLGCHYSVIPISEGMKAFDAMLGDTARAGVTPENIQSRLRGMLLMALSNTTGLMVVPTGNKSEMAVGYATLYGDMCGGYAILKDVYKTDVFAICKWLNMRGTATIPERIITRPPSAELKPDQTDQDTLPPYDVLDRILYGLIEQDLGPDDLVAQGFDAATVGRVRHMLDLAEYKRRQAAPGAKIGPRAFGRDRRYPITSGFKPQPLEKPQETR